MNVENFVKELSKGVHTQDYYLKRGLSFEKAIELIDDEKRMYQLNFKISEIPEVDDPIEHLICDYDTSNLEIGMVSLGKKEINILLPKGKVLIGFVEADPIVVNTQNGIIELLDYSEPNYVMAICASSSEKFLDALILLVQYDPPYLDLFGRLSEKQKKENNKSAHEMAKKCAEVAGISGLNNIYETLLGCE